jgi:hypothetical protein
MRSLLNAPRLTCTHGALRLSLRPHGGAPGEFRVRVTRYDRDRPFERGLVILPGTVLRLQRGRREACFATVRFFEQTIQYRRFCASGRLVVECGYT